MPPVEEPGDVVEQAGSSGGRVGEAGVPDPELAPRAKRRKYTAKYKLAVVTEADGCTRPGEVGALLRREGLYSSHLGKWREQRGAGALGALAPRQRSPQKPSADAAELARVRGQLARSETDLWNARRVIEVQGKVRALGGVVVRERDRDRRGVLATMIDASVAKIAPIIGTASACRALGASRASLYRRRLRPRVREPRPRRPAPRALSEVERTGVLEQLNSPRFVDCSAAQAWATLLDEGTYLASERTMYRLLASEHGPARDRRAQLTHPPYARPELLASGPNELHSWDITKLKGPAK